MLGLEHACQVKEQTQGSLPFWPCAGKTTFIQNMFAAYAQNASLSVNDASAPTAKEDFVSDPEKLCTEIVVRDQQNQVAFHYRVQGLPR